MFITQHPQTAHLFLLYNRFLDAFHNIMYIIICHVWSCWQAETYLEQFFLYTIGVDRSIGVYRLLVHRFPNRTAFNLLAKHEHAQSLYIFIGLTICHS